MQNIDDTHFKLFPLAASTATIRCEPYQTSTATITVHRQTCVCAQDVKVMHGNLVMETFVAPRIQFGHHGKVTQEAHQCSAPAAVHEEEALF